MSIPQIIQKSLTLALKQEKGLGFIRALLQKFPEAEVFLVGGIVRDWLLKRPSKDFDFVIRGIPAKKLAVFLKTQGTVNLVGERFGVFKFQSKNSASTFDIALPRTEHALGTGGYRDVETQSDYKLPLEQDLARRDFTINALALQLGIKNKKIIALQLIDAFTGLVDLKKKIIRTVGEPQERFKEDYSRLLRGLRFSAVLNFDLENKTWEALKKQISQINKEIQINGEKKRLVPYEIVAREFLKSLIKNPVKTMDLWLDSGAFKYLMPEILKMKDCPQPPQFHAEGDVWTHTRIALATIHTSGFKKFIKTLPINLQTETQITPELVVGVLFHDLGKPYTIKTPEKDGVDRIRTDEHDSVGAELIKKIGGRLKFSSVEDYPCNTDKVAWMIQRHLLTVHGDPMKFTNRTIEKNFFNPLVPGADLLKLIYCDQMASFVGGKPQLGSLPVLVKRIKLLLKNLKQKKTLPPPLLDGHELMKILKIQSGPKVGQYLEELREAQLSRKIKNKKEATRWLQKIIS